MRYVDKATLFDSKKITLLDLLSCIKNNIDDYIFQIFEFDGLLSAKSKFDINQIEDNAIKDEKGYQIKGRELYQLAEEVEQVYHLILAGNLKGITKFSDSNEWRSKNDIVIEMVDCGPWEVWGQVTDIFDEKFHSA